jgi:hypothetical protein
MKRDLIAEHLCNLQPASIRNRHLDNTEFIRRFGLAPQHGLLIGDTEIDLKELISAVRRMLKDKKERTILDKNGKIVHLVYDNSEIILKRKYETKNESIARLNELLILSPCLEERRRAYDGLSKYMGPTAPDFSLMRIDFDNRELSDQEVEEIFYEIMKGVTSHHKRLTIALRTHNTNINDFIPNTLAYFERFCGPNPEEASPEIYLCNILPTHRKELLRRDLIRGLDICLYGALRDDLSPGQWTSDVDIDDLWNALMKCKPTRDPFSLLGALDIALYRQYDERYRKFADDAVMKLTHHDYLRPDGIDAYQFIPLLAELVLNRINIIEAGAMQPPYWKRMCAWMQSLFIANQTLPYSLEFESFSSWVRAQMSLAGFYATLIDLRSEPICEASAMSPVSLRQEILGRLSALRLRHKNEGREIVKDDVIEATLVSFTSQPHSLPWCCALPGPLEGHKRPVDCGGVIFPSEVVKEMVKKMEEEKDEVLLSIIAHFSQFFILDETLLQSARKLIDGINICSIEAEERLQHLSRLTDACAIAAACRDIALAKIIGNKILSFTYEATSENQVEYIIRGILLAGSAFADEHEWAVWLEEQFTKIASILPYGKMAEVFLNHLAEIKKVIRLDMRILGRAEAIASAAV